MTRRASRTLWSGGAGLDPRVEVYTAADDRVWDARLLDWDILGSIAHARGLERAGVVTPRERDRLVAALRRALADTRAGRLRVTKRDEDVHTAVERRLTERLGALGARIHTGRSRNDQVLVDLRLYEKDALLGVAAAGVEAAETLVAFGRRHARVIWPGYTHQRRAMPSTVGLWAAGYAEGIVDDVAAILSAVDLLDRSPLGSAAGFGVPLALPRERVARDLGFARAHHAVTAAQPSRGKLEAVALAALWALGSSLGKLAWDVILFSSEEFGFLRLPVRLATGSSIMPHKKNPDLFELTRAREGALAGCLAQVIAIAGKLPGGYHRDLQMLKAPVMSALDAGLAMARMTAIAIPALEVDRARCLAAVDDGVLATDAVYGRVREGVPFRDAYREVAELIRRGGRVARPSTAAILASRSDPGGAGDPSLPAIARDVAALARETARRRSRFDRAMAGLEGRS